HDAHVVQLHHHFEGARVEEVADQHAGGIAPQRIGGGAAAAHVGGVDHVVMQQGGGVHEFDDGGEHVRALVGQTTGARTKQHDQGPQSLAAGADNVVANLLDKGDARMQLTHDQ